MKLSFRGILAYLLATAVFLIILMVAGVFDPKPVGKLQTTLPATSLMVSEPGQTITWLNEPLPGTDFSVRGTAVWQSGSQDSGVGFVLGSEANHFIVAISPLGYVMIQQDDTAALPWQPWPHIQQQAAPNEIWLDVRGKEITVRINREILWQGNYYLADRQLGLFGEDLWGNGRFRDFPLSKYLRHSMLNPTKKWQSLQGSATFSVIGLILQLPAQHQR